MVEQYHKSDLIKALANWTYTLENDQDLVNAVKNLNKDEPTSFGLAFENLLRDRRNKYGLGYIKLDIEDPRYISDSHNGDFELRLWNYILRLDFKISVYNTKCGGVTTTSLNNFGGWYVCCSSDLFKIYLIDADYLRDCVRIGKVKTSSCPNYYLYNDYECILEEGKQLNAVIEV